MGSGPPAMKPLPEPAVEEAAPEEPVEILGAVDVPRRRQLLPRPAEAPEAGPGLGHDLRRAPRDVAEEERIDAPEPDQRVPAVGGREEDRVAPAAQRLARLAQPPRADRRAVGPDQ